MLTAPPRSWLRPWSGCLPYWSRSWAARISGVPSPDQWVAGSMGSGNRFWGPASRAPSRHVGRWPARWRLRAPEPRRRDTRALSRSFRGNGGCPERALPGALPGRYFVPSLCPESAPLDGIMWDGAGPNGSDLSKRFRGFGGVSPRRVGKTEVRPRLRTTAVTARSAAPRRLVAAGRTRLHWQGRSHRSSRHQESQLWGTRTRRKRPEVPLSP
jgi:hypothetical protein